MTPTLTYEDRSLFKKMKAMMNTGYLRRIDSAKERTYT